MAERLVGPFHASCRRPTRQRLRLLWAVRSGRTRCADPKNLDSHNFRQLKKSDRELVGTEASKASSAKDKNDLNLELDLY